MKNLFTIISLIVLSVICLGAYEPHFMSDPAISPDGEKVCFVYDNDLWSVPFEGGIAKRLTSTDASEFSPAWSPDGTTIAFSSNREGQTWTYIMPSEGGNSSLVFKESLTLCGWFSDNMNLLCSKYNLNYGTSLYKLSLAGLRPTLVAEIGDNFCSLSPDDNKIIFNRHGDPYRPAYKGSANGDLWEYDLTTQTYSRLTKTDYTERYPQYSYTSDSVYFCASDGSRYQLFKAPANDFSQSEQLSDFVNWSVRDISIARQNNRIAFELFDSIWSYDPDLPDNERCHKIPIEISEDDWRQMDVQEKVINNFDKYAVSGDDLLLAFSYRFDLFVMPRKGGEVRQVTFNQTGIDNIAFLSDNRTIIFSQYNNGIIDLNKCEVDSVLKCEPVYWYGADSNNVDDFYNSDSKNWIITYTDSLGSGRIAVADSAFNNIRPVITDMVVSDFSISPDDSMAVFTAIRDNTYVRDLYLYDLQTHNKRKLFTEDSWISSPLWLHDQKSFLISLSDENRKICRIDLIPRDELELDVDNWKEIFEKPDSLDVKAKKLQKDNKSNKLERLKYADVDWNDIDKRIYPILSGDDYMRPALAIDDTSFYFVKTTHDKDRKFILCKANIFGKHSSDIISVANASDYQFVADKVLYYKESDKLKSYNLKTKSKTDLKNEVEYEYNQLVLNEKVFEQAWGIFGRNFYDPDMHGRNWNRLYDKFKPYLQYADNTKVLEILIEELIGELNSSHTGYYPRRDNSVTRKSVAWLGLEFNQRKMLPVGLEITRAYKGSNLYNYYGIREGDILMSVNGKYITPEVSVDSLLLDKTGEKLELSFLKNNKPVKAVTKGLSWSQNRELWYQNKVDKNRAIADMLSDNRIGYVLIPHMSSSDYSNFLNDVFTKNSDKKGLVIDIRGNGGGRIHNNLLDFLSKKPNALTTSRRFGSVKNLTPARVWNKPLVLLIDENSFSDAEIFPQLFKEAKLGTVIGVPTSGSVIGTWEVSLMDGSSMRMPGSGWYRLDGTNMEGNGAQPDILIERNLNDIVADRDTQLQKAVSVLLEKLE